jgi:hypothetical protein
MPFVTLVSIALLLCLLTCVVLVLILIILLVRAEPPQTNVMPTFWFNLIRRPAGDRVVPINARRITGREPLHDALARWHSRPLLLVNYRDNDQIHVRGFPKDGESGIDPEIIEVPLYPWDCYKPPHR